MRRTTAAWAVLALAVSFATACSSEEGSKAGGDAVPVTLRIGTDDGPGRPAADQIQEFARQVDAMSAGQITIEPVWNADGPVSGTGTRGSLGWWSAGIWTWA